MVPHDDTICLLNRFILIANKVDQTVFWFVFGKR